MPLPGHGRVRRFHGRRQPQGRPPPFAGWALWPSDARPPDHPHTHNCLSPRQIALDQLVEEGLARKHVQFIFITPQDLSSITPTREVKIIKLQDPGRQVAGQTTL